MQPLDEAATEHLHARIAEHDELVGTRFWWEGEYEYTAITLRRHVGPPGLRLVEDGADDA